MKNGKVFLIFGLLLMIYAKHIYPQAGQLDTTFGHGGVVTNIINPIRQNSFPRALVIRNVEKIVVGGSTNNEIFAMQYDQHGKLDNSFGLNGIATANAGESLDARSLAMQNDGKLIAAGYSNKGGRDNFALVRYTIDGNKDFTFGNNGIVITPLGISSYSNKVLIQPDGKIVLVGSSKSDNQSDYNFTLARYNSDGTLDNTFGHNGAVFTTIGTSASYPYSAQIQVDGKIVVAGLSLNGKKVITLIRYKVDGNLDNTFGSGGVVTTPIGVSDSEARSVAIQEDGKIVVAGDYSNGFNNDDFVIARYDSDGTLDFSFGTNGITLTPIGEHNDEPNSIVIQSDGKIIAAGRTYNVTEGDYALVRYNSNGSLDDSFGNNGIKITSIENSSEQAYDVAKLSNGKIVATGSIDSDTNGSNSITVRYNADGSLDNTFGDNGIVITEVKYSMEYTTSVVLQNKNDNEKIITLSNIWNGSDNDFALNRFNPDGTLDNTFGINGKTIKSIKDSSSDDFESLIIQNDGKIIASGSTYIDNERHSVAVRYTSDGSLDNTFGMGGIALLPANNSVDFVYSAAIQNDGKIIACGYSYLNNGAVFAAVRYNVDGSFDNTFGSEGKAFIPIGSSYDFAFSSAIQDDDKIILAGSYRNGDKDNFSLVRLTADGKLDSTFGTDGLVTSPIGSSNNRCYSIKLQNDGKIIAAGSYGNIKIGEVALVRYNSDGSFDSTFGNNGIVLTPTPDSASVGYSLKLQDDGKIVVGGTDKDRSFLILRYNNNGSLDSTFGENGLREDKYGVPFNLIKSIAIQKDGNIIAAGNSINRDETMTVNTIIRYTGDKKTSNITENLVKEIPTSFKLLQNYPNPFNPSTKIGYSIPSSGSPIPGGARGGWVPIQLKIYNILGKEVSTLINENQQPGNYEIEFNAANTNNKASLPSGVYFYKLDAGNFHQVKKMILLK